jgi:hypothetical protein
MDKDLNNRIRRWKWGATARGIRWNITSDYINSMPKICHYTGLELSIRRNQPNTLSLDRINSLGGYTKNNVVFCCARINTMKSDMSVKEFLNWCITVAKHKKTR